MKLDHIAIVVKDLDKAISTFSQKLGIPFESRSCVEQEGIEIAVMTMDNAHIELVKPLGNNSAVTKFLEKRGEGLHHICLEVDNIETLIKSLQALGVKLIDTKPRTGYKGNKAIFVHPSSTHGVLIEFYEK